MAGFAQLEAPSSEIPLLPVTRSSQGSTRTSLSKQDVFFQAKAYTKPSYSGFSKPLPAGTFPCLSLPGVVQREAPQLLSPGSKVTPRLPQGSSSSCPTLLQPHPVIPTPSGSGILQGGELPLEVLTRVCGATSPAVHSSTFPCTLRAQSTGSASLFIHQGVNQQLWSRLAGISSHWDASLLSVLDFAIDPPQGAWPRPRAALAATERFCSPSRFSSSPPRPPHSLSSQHSHFQLPGIDADLIAGASSRKCAAGCMCG